MFRSSRSRLLLFALLMLSSLLLAAVILGDWLPPFTRTCARDKRVVLALSSASAAAVVAVSYRCCSSPLSAVWWLSIATSKRSQTLTALLLWSSARSFLQVSPGRATRVDVAAELVDRTLSNQASGFFEPAAEITDIKQVLASISPGNGVVLLLITLAHTRPD